MPATFRAWERHLQRTTADAVFILGDLFEVWVGDDARSQAFERRCVDVLAQAASHRQLAFMVGNRDFLVGRSLLREAGMMALPDPTVLSAWGQNVLLSHGDALCLTDTALPGLPPRGAHPAAWQQAFLARPLAERVALAAQMRQASAKRWKMDSDAAADVDPGEAVRWMHSMGAAEMVHGHTHRPGSNTLAPASSATCSATGTWTPATAPRCCA